MNTGAKQGARRWVAVIAILLAVAIGVHCQGARLLRRADTAAAVTRSI